MIVRDERFLGHLRNHIQENRVVSRHITASWRESDAETNNQMRSAIWVRAPWIVWGTEAAQCRTLRILARLAGECPVGPGNGYQFNDKGAPMTLIDWISSHKRILRVFLVFCLISLTAQSCPPTPAPVIGPNDTFMFSYIDRQGRVRVRWSQDGWRWEDGDIQTSPIHDSGVGSAAGVDNVGLARWIAYPDISGRLVLHAALGAVFDSNGDTVPTVQTHGAPAMTAISGGNWVVATLGGSLNQAAVFNVFNNPSSLTDITSNVPAAVENNQLLRPPQIMSRGGTFVAAWMRWQAVGTARVPIGIRILRGTDAGGTIAWQGDSPFTNTEPGFGGALTDPALTHDGQDFLLGVIRRESGGGDEFLFIYRSPDAITWTLSERIEVPFGTGTTVRIAAHGTGKMFVGVNGTSSASFYRKWKGEWEPVHGANVYGTSRPNWYPFSVIAAGKLRPDIYVDGSVATSGDGSQSSPYQTIQEATNDAKRGDRILLAATGFYRENVTLPSGVTLEGWNGEPLISVFGFDPVIVAQGDNYIKRIHLENLDASTGILADLATALDGLEGDGSEAYLDVEDSTIATQNFGVFVTADPGLAFGGDNRRNFRPRIRHNRINGHATGIRIEVNGPSTGMLQIPIEAYDNLLSGNFTGIRLKMIGGAPNTGGFARATVTGRIRNNLIIDGANGVSFEAENAGTISTPLYFNTIANNSIHNVICTADPGSNGQSRVSTRLGCNILANAGNFGFIEFTDRCNPAQFQNNVFFGNTDHYDNFPATPINSQAALNSPTTGGTGNLIADPLFEEGGYPLENGFDFGRPGDFFLTQSGSTMSPAVDLCPSPFTLEENGLDGLTTRTDYNSDVAPPDAGYHYTP